MRPSTSVEWVDRDAAIRRAATLFILTNLDLPSAIAHTLKNPKYVNHGFLSFDEFTAFQNDVITYINNPFAYIEKAKNPLPFDDIEDTQF